MAETEQKKTKAPSSKKRRRTIWLIAQWVGIPLLSIAALAVGLVMGYVYIGKRPLEDVYEIETWRHLYDLVFA
ncbi:MULTISPECIES: DNA-directed RNA polymerase subunit beta [Paenibacillus]|uniref:DNA-directed RNA polymerase subunit beta n=1 Tax=Paenibacillus radicis (ex Xue et al. 2023) TaxID=2972489 RepID=A0ABT1YHY9_9BACL|nr:DNA-directed RNA polymerase subunit beta [Paenibacillus radicis (ex Xue et al. 2023)]MCR8632345.1 DNA-directed RNA polymerase subunit beta [Paenibacillus radicis (ex Xue et al. 2023)]